MASTYTVCDKCKKVNRINLDEVAKQDPVCGHCQAELNVHGYLSNVSASGLQALVKSSPLPVVVDFWAPWCGPCRMFAPVYEQVAKEEVGKKVFVKVDTQEHPLAGDFYGVRGIPTLVVFKGGVEVARQSGAMPAPMFKQWLTTVEA